jgi:hypothetical protein
MTDPPEFWKKYVEKVIIIRISGDESEGHIYFKLKGLEIESFIPSWQEEGWYKEVYPEGFDYRYLDEHDTSDDKKPMMDFSGEKRRIILYLISGKNKKINQPDKFIGLKKEGVWSPHLIRGKIIEMGNSYMAVDCGCFITMKIPKRGYKVNDYIEIESRLDVHKPEYIIDDEK